jgi:cAMP-dependent protein kinase regulator
LYNAPRAATIIAKEEGVLWTLDRETFNNIVKEAAIKKRKEYESFLKSVDILKQIEPYELSQICDALKVKKVKAGEYIIKQNDVGEEFYIIEQGEAVATKVIKEGHEAEEVFAYQPGGYFGELALIKNEPRAANVIAKTDCNLLTLERKSFKRLLGPIENILKRNSNDYLKYIGDK